MTLQPTPDTPLPDRLELNAWTGRSAASGALAQRLPWLFRAEPLKLDQFRAPQPPADPANWKDPRVGWGLVLPDRRGRTAAELASADDAPRPIRDLVAARNGPVFRYQAGSENRFRHLRRYFPDGSLKDISISGAPRGTAAAALPAYLLIYAGPDEIPWSLQYTLNARCAVGRIDLRDTPLENYVSHLLGGWAGAGSVVAQPVVWSVNWPGDITELMHNAIARPVATKLAGDADIGRGATFLNGPSATGAELAVTLAARKPALVVTTSHGMTGPLEDANRMLGNLGLLVDDRQDLVSWSPPLSQRWMPDGAIWYAHACCSAGSDGEGNFDGLLEPGSDADRVLKAVAGLGSHVAPFPRALLGAAKPLRAFVGHVEPTFNWTIRQPETGQFRTGALHEALYDGLCAARPVGLALRNWFDQIGVLAGEYDTASLAFGQTGAAKTSMLYSLLAQRDVRSVVILGDPTVALPPLA